jgi:hypothetical protein
MFRCENCGTGYNATVVSVLETCPRCKAGGTEAKLSFRLFELDRASSEPPEQTADAESTTAIESRE